VVFFGRLGVARLLQCTVVSSTSHEQKEAISPTGAVEQMRQFRRPPDQLILAVWGLKSQKMQSQRTYKFRKFSVLRADGRRLRSLCIDILACHDGTIRAITIIRLNLNPPFKNPRSATAVSNTTISKVPQSLRSLRVSECANLMTWDFPMPPGPLIHGKVVETAPVLMQFYTSYGGT